MSSSPRIDNKKKDILILGKVPTQGLEHTLTAEKFCSINFTKENTKFCLSLHYNGANSYLFVNDTEIINPIQAGLLRALKSWVGDHMVPPVYLQIG